MKKFRILSKDVSSNFCISEEYTICPLYKIIVENQPYCKYIEDCAYHFHRLDNIVHHDTEVYKRIKNIFQNYCLSKNFEKCERYKIKKDDKYIPRGLLPDGQHLKFSDIFKVLRN